MMPRPGGRATEIRSYVQRPAAPSVSLIVGAVLALFALYEISVRYFAYTADAYVMSDIVVISSEIEGPVSRLAVQNNDSVTAGQLLFAIETTPYQLKVQETQAALQQAQADLDLARDEVKSAQAGVSPRRRCSPMHRRSSRG